MTKPTHSNLTAAQHFIFLNNQADKLCDMWQLIFEFLHRCMHTLRTGDHPPY